MISNENDKRYLSDVLDVNEIVNSEKNKFCIISGVGSGKNYFVENVLSKHGNILYITSRRAKVDEIVANELCQEKINWKNLDSDITVLTNHGVELLVKNKKFKAGIKNIVEHYRFVVVDEAHSIFTDATFTDSAFHVYAFITHISEVYPKIKIILMTGTPEPIEKYLIKAKAYERIDKTGECICVLPKSIEIIYKNDAVKRIRRMKKNEKVIYYSNTASQLVKGERSIFEQLIRTKRLCEDEIAFCMSSSAATKLNKSIPKLKEKNDNIKKHIAHENRLPENIRVLLTTSTLKEGINLIDPDIKIGFCESHLLSDIQQFAGRVRNGLEKLYIISDVKQHVVTDDELKRAKLEYAYNNLYLKDAANQFINNYILKPDSEVYDCLKYKKGSIELHESFFEGVLSIYSAYENEASPVFIDLIMERNPYIQFNHIKTRFETYTAKLIEEARINKCLFHQNWDEDVKKYAEQRNISFYNSIVKVNVYDHIQEILFFLQEYKDKMLMGDEKAWFIGSLAGYFGINPNSKTTTFNKLFKKYDLRFRLLNKHTKVDGKNVRYLKIEENKE